MSTTEVLLGKASELVRRRRKLLRDKAYVEALFYGLLFCLIAGALWRGGILSLNIYIAYASIIALSMAAAAAISSVSKAEPMEALIAADTALGTKERLSTAYEFATKGIDNIYLGLLVEDAASKVAGVRPDKVFPRTYPSKLKYIPFLLAGVVLMTALDFNFNFSFGSSPADSVVKAEGKKIERAGEQLEKKASEDKLNQSLEASKKMQELGQRLRNERMDRKEAEERVSDLAERLRRQGEDMRRRLMQQGVSGTEMERMLAPDRDFEAELRDLINRLSSGNPSAQQRGDMEDDLSRLKDQNEAHRQDLSRALSALQSGDMEEAKEILESILSDRNDLQDLAELQSAQDALERSQRALAGSGPPSQEMMGESGEGMGEEGSPMPGSADAGNPAPGGGGGDEEMPGLDENGFGSQPGTKAAKDEPGEPGEIETSSAEASKVKGQLELNKGDMRRSFVRSLPLKTKSGVAEENLLVDYQRRAEEVMVKEDIPLNFREYIRNYFLLIGVIESKQ